MSERNTAELCIRGGKILCVMVLLRCRAFFKILFRKKKIESSKLNIMWSVYIEPLLSLYIIE